MSEFNPPLGSSDPSVFEDNVKRLDKLVNGPATEVPDRSGEPLDSWREMMERNDEIRQNLIPLSRQYMTIEAAQADIANVPDGSTTYVRSTEERFLAQEFINKSGTLTATGRKLPSYELIKPIVSLIESVLYAENNEYARSSADSAILDKNRRWLLQWRGDELLLKNAEVEGFLKTNDLLVEGAVSFNEAKITDLKATSVDVDNIKIGGISVPVELVVPDEYMRSPADSAIMDNDHRWLLYWEGDKLNLKNLYVKNNVSTACIEFLEPDEYARVPYLELTLDKNLRIYRTVDDAGHVVISGVRINPDPHDRDSYEVFEDSGKLYRISKVTSIRELIDSSPDNSDVQNAPDIFTFKSTRDETVIGNRWFSSYEPYKPAAYFGRRAIVGFGHSFMANPRFLRTLSDLTGLPTYNFGRSGGLSRTVALREGAYTVSYTPVGGSIPASGSVALTPADPGVLQVVGNASLTEVVKGNIAGVDGSLAWDGTTLTFTRENNGTAVPVSKPEPFIYYPYTIDSTNTVASGVRYDDHGDAINLLWVGRNNATQQGQILSDVKAIIGNLTAHHKRFVLLPEFQMASETKTTYGNGNILWLNRELKKMAPNNYCEIDGIDLLANFNAHYNPAYAQDVADIANGITPTSLRQDSLHPSQTLQANALYIGADVNAQFVYQFLLKKGWL
ncbi:TPA: hypothetical protein ACXEPV_002403 [Klebsiella pneumoniae]